MKLNFELNMMVFNCDRVIQKGNMTLKQDLINLRPH